MRWLGTVGMVGMLAACHGTGDDHTAPVDADKDGVTAGQDCDDSRSDVYPGADELCDHVDNDCDGETDEGAEDATVFYLDVDEDRYGDPAVSRMACAAPDGYVPDGSDCDDLNPAVHPGATEVCDALDVDEDCDGLADDDDDSTDPLSKPNWYPDWDGDGYGAGAEESVASCEDPSDTSLSYVRDSSDCNDANRAVYPGAPERCDALDTDENCDGLAENDAPDNDPETLTLYYVDGDWDGFGDADDLGTGWCDDPSTSVAAWSTENTDCDDSDDSVFPGAKEVFDFQDGNCDSVGDRKPLIQTEAKLTGEAAYDYLGQSVSSAGDLDGDGMDDLLIGAIGDDDGGVDAGAVYIVMGSKTRLSDMSVSSADAKLTGEASEDLAGRSLSAAGDVNGDGYADILVGADHENGRGAVYLVLGSKEGISDMSLSQADAKFTAASASGCLGRSVSAAGDVNGDGYSDVLVGDFCDDEWIGAAYVVLGSSDPTDVSVSKADAILTGESEDDRAAQSVSAAGDVDGDGYGDVLVGAPREDDYGTDAGAAYLLMGSSTGVSDGSLSTADAKMTGEWEDDRAGSSVSSAGDVNNDGYSDLILGAYGHDYLGSNEGAAYIVLGSSAGISDMNLSAADAKLTGVNSGDAAGIDVATAGDVNGDGFGDVLVGATGDDDGDPDAGAAYIVLGSSGGIADMSLRNAHGKLTGQTWYDRAGSSLSAAGDIDDDGYSDVLVGAYLEDDGGTSAGAVYLMYGF